ncbi:hypothetical protein [Peijinzhouia sedimentorum]
MSKKENIEMEQWDDLLKSSIRKNAPSHLEDGIMDKLPTAANSNVKIKRRSLNLPLLFAGGISVLTAILWLISFSTNSDYSFTIPDQFDFTDSLQSFFQHIDLGLDVSVLSFAMLAIAGLFTIDYIFQSLYRKKRFY